MSYKAWHGTKGDPKWALPSVAATSNEANRADQGNEIKANEYLDSPAVLKAKVKMMATMVRQAKHCCAYTGAGLSKSSGIPDYATKATNSIVAKAPKLKSNLDAEPTYAHCALTAMERAGFLHHYVQQNHDGLPQKSGFPQEKINEIHGAWFDPSNPVVQFSGSLRGDLFKWMIDMEKKIDLCLCLGTSLSGMNADRVAETPAKKSQRDPTIIGTIIVNIQQTRLDDVCALRIWGKLDDVFTLLGKELELGKMVPQLPPLPATGDIFELPYNEHGMFDPTCKMTLDLRQGKKVFIPIKGASNFGAKGVVIERKDCSYSIQLQEGERITRRLFGVWWIHSAARGKVDQLPLINIDPTVTTITTHSIASASNPAPQPMEVNENAVGPSQPPKPKHIAIIQSHERVESATDNKHRWGLSIDPTSSPLVEQVSWHLHPTFHPPTISCTEPPFVISMLGWGTFVVTAEIKLKPEYGAQVLKGDHELTFNGGGVNVKTTLVPTQ